MIKFIALYYGIGMLMDYVMSFLSGVYLAFVLDKYGNFNEEDSNIIAHDCMQYATAIVLYNDYLFDERVAVRFIAKIMVIMLYPILGQAYVYQVVKQADRLLKHFK